MRKRTKYSLVVIIFLLIVGALYYSGVFAISQGFFVLSGGPVDFRSNDPELGGAWWLITVSQNGAGNYIIGTFSPEDIKDTAENVQAQYPLKLEMTLDKQTCSWGIARENKYVKNMEVEKQDCTFICDWDARKNNCLASHDDAIYYKPIGLTGWCIWFVGPGQPHGSISTKSIGFESTLKATVNNQIETGTLTSKDQTSIWLGDKIFATWVGSLTTGDDCPQTNDYTSIWIPGSGWRIIDKDTWNVYYNYYQTGVKNCIDGGVRTPEQCKDEYDRLKSNALQPKPLSSSGGSIAYTTGTETTGQIKIDLAKQILNQVISMKIKADWIGVYQPVGDPKIRDISVPTIKTGDSAVVTVNVENVGGGSGYFDVSVTCDNYVSQQGSAPRIAVAPHQIGTAYVSVTASAITDSTAQCTAKAYDVNNPNNFDTKAFSVTVKTIVVCTGGERQCNGKILQECKADGSGWFDLKDCEYGCMAGACQDAPDIDEICDDRIDNDGDGLVDEDDPDCQGIQCEWWDVPCHIRKFFDDLLKGLAEFFAPLIMIVAIIGSLLAILFSKNLLAVEAKLKGKALWISSIIIGAMVGILIYLYFWIGVAVFIIYMIISTVLGRRR